MPDVMSIGPRAQAHDVIVVGAGQAGLATSYLLKQRGIGHVVLEKTQIADSWRAQRWDSFVLNSPNALNGLPGAPCRHGPPDGFGTAEEIARSFEEYAGLFALPVRTGIEVTGVERAARGFVVRTRAAGGLHETWHTGAVVVASGIMRLAKVPALAARLPASIAHIHSSRYRNPAALPAGAVMVVGSGQSGCQIAEELNAVGRKVFLCTSKVGRLPRRYRGREIMHWLWDSGFLHASRADLADPSICRAAQPQVSGVGRLGHTVSLQQLARDGVVLLGRLAGADQAGLDLGDELAEHIRFADQKSAEFKRHVDAYIARAGIEAPPPETDPADEPFTRVPAAPTRLELGEAGISTVVWCTGFRPDFTWLPAQVRDAEGTPLHERGVSALPGIYFVGFPWLRQRKSGIICGVEEDAGHVVDQIARRQALAA